LVQETVIRAWRFLHTFDPQRGARGWLFKILMHVHVDSRRRRRREPETADLLEPEAVDHHYLYRQVAGSDGAAHHSAPAEESAGAPGEPAVSLPPARGVCRRPYPARHDDPGTSPDRNSIETVRRI
jgi:DNA-directed RNA polymerase specialized sigma24 family protein